MNIEQTLEQLNQEFSIVAIIDLDNKEYNKNTFDSVIKRQLENIRKDEYQSNERIVFTICNDYYQKNSILGLKLTALQENLNLVDISNFFCVIVTPNSNIKTELVELQAISHDPVPVHVVITDGDFTALKIETTQKKYRYSSPDLIKMGMDELSERQLFLLTESSTFCIYPWTHLHAYPTGEAYPCCGAEPKSGPVGDCRKNTLKEIWNSDGMKKLRTDMLSETWNSACTRCYEQEKSGFFSMRNSANKHLGHHIAKVDKTNANGSVDDFEMVYWDIRFSNLCNLKCRSCGYIFSSQWHSDQVKLLKDFGPDFAKKTKVLNYAGRNQTDIWEQLIPHLDYVEQIYFAGGEPLMMEEHYNILDELERRGRFDVRLIYNTNFTQTRLKDREVFDYWKKFKSVAIGASLDDMGPRAEYIRKGTNWDIVERNRRAMIEVCPEVDFYISPTLSIMNAWSLPDFHRSWVEQGLIKPQDLNVNILQDPAHYRIDIAPAEFKEQLNDKYQKHLEWLRPLDPLNRATVGFESAIKFMMTTDNTHLIDTFWKKTYELDAIRNENILDVIPELRALK
jgi:MoaA/NifB/PqqE/SkfB family radical SAM enzyme